MKKALLLALTLAFALGTGVAEAATHGHHAKKASHAKHVKPAKAAKHHAKLHH
ncbi:hypothetical protein ACLSSQ_05800 [Azospira sp. APE16]|uniref:hypothetical protein n=1 Tax=Azospira sp. APE16 TaxID=3394231 RepID=UPI001B72DD0B|nr:hypothetical protein [Azospira sp.]